MEADTCSILAMEQTSSYSLVYQDFSFSFKALNSSVAEVQVAGNEALKKVYPKRSVVTRPTIKVLYKWTCYS